MKDAVDSAGPDLDEVEAQLAAGYSIPYSWYNDDDIFHREIDMIWRRSWHVAGPVAQVANAGDHFTCEASGTPILVVRGREGDLRAFLNVCRHRGYPVAEGSGSRKWFQCQYHAWTYNLDGSLKGAPGCQDDATFDKSAISLAPVAVDVIAGVVFVNPDPEAVPLRQAHPTLHSWVEKLDLDLTKYVHRQQMTFSARGNWKLVYENASECYHCATIHPTSLTSIYDPHGEREICDERLVIAHAPRLDGEGQGIRAIMGFPGFVVQQDDYVGISAQIMADGQGLTRFVADIYANPDLSDSELAEHVDLWQRTFQEDMDVVDKVSKGIGVGRLDRGRLIANREERTAHIQRILLDAHREAVAGQHEARS